MINTKTFGGSGQPGFFTGVSAMTEKSAVTEEYVTEVVLPPLERMATQTATAASLKLNNNNSDAAARLDKCCKEIVDILNPELTGENELELPGPDLSPFQPG